MTVHSRSTMGGVRPWFHWLQRWLVVAVVLALIVGPISIDLQRVPPAAAQACVGGVTLDIRDYNSGDPIAAFTYLVNEDNTGDPFDPDPSQHPGVKPMASYSPIVAAGDQSNATLALPDGRYLVSVRATGYKLWGKHLNIPLDCGPVTIELTPEPLPLAQLRVHAFHDNQPINGFPDFAANVETGLEGFHVTIHDVVGEVTVDWFGNPLCTDYYPPGTVIDGFPLTAGPGGIGYDADGSPVPVPHTGGFCVTDANGDALIRHIPHGKYEVIVIPPDGTDWVQTTTYEGTKVIDAWLEEGADGLGPEAFIEPELQTAHIFGFVHPMDFPPPTGNEGTIKGTVKHFAPFPPGETLAISDPVYKPWIALTDLGSNDQQVYLGRGGEDGTFTINNVPPGLYQMVIWDEPLDLIMMFYTVRVGVNETVDMGDVGAFRWFGWVSGDVFLDDGLNNNRLTVPGGAANNGIRDCDPADPGNKAACERALPGIDLDIRHRDGSIRAATFTDRTGHYEYPEALSKMLKMEVAEVGFGRFARTGHSIRDELATHFPDADHDGDLIANKYDPDLVSPVSDELGGGLLLNQYTLEAKRSIIDWGKRPYDIAAGENGGISGVVLYAVTRNEFDARLAAAEDYEPGIPGVTVRLWGLGSDGQPNTSDDVLLNEVETDSWSHPRPDHPDLPQECDVRDANGNPLTNPASVYVAQYCIEVPMLGNETKAGAFDGGYAFETYVDSFGFEHPLPPGDYVVEVVPPPFYQILKEEDQNTDEGPELEAIVELVPPPPCVGPLHTVNDPRNPYDGQQKPLCNKRLVRLQAGQNPAADFFLFTDSDTDGDATTRNWDTTQAVPMPGRFFGLVEDNLILNNDPDSITYGELRSVAGIPIGVYDYSGRHLVTVYTDENGFYEVLIPSTYQANCPIPSGICPGMYRLVIDDPGDPANPNPGYSGAYRTEPYVFDAWPAKMTPTDTPVQPINTLVCSVPPDTPQIFAVSQPYSSGALSLGIKGTRFGAALPPTVTLDDDDGVADPVTLSVTGWAPANLMANPPVFEDVVTATVPAGLPARMYQLSVINNTSGAASVNGLTFHKLGAGYNPPIVTVNPTTDPAATPIQDAIDAAAAGSLIIVQPGHYRENPILHKRVKLQGYGPGGFVGAPPVPEQEINPADPPTTQTGEEPFAHILGSVIDGRFHQFVEANRLAWDATLAGAASPYGGPADVPSGAAITVVAAPGELDAVASFRAQIDGFGITGSRGEGSGGIYVHAYGRNLIISNNIIENNSGRYGGGLGLGQPTDFGGLANNENDNIRIHHNRILGNGGTFRAGGVGIFNGADNYDFAYNDVCGNYSAEYGGGISHYGLSPNGRIRDNLIYYNDAFDEGGGVMIAGERPVDAGGVGSGPVDLTHNLIQANLSNDDGGGVRLLRPLTPRITIANNFIVNNVATDFGGGIALDDASNVVIVNNTIADNMTTATAEDTDGNAHGAGLVSEGHSAAFQATLPPGAPTFSNPTLFNNIFWNNRAFTWDGAALVFDSVIDMEVFGTVLPQFFTPRFSVLSVPYGTPHASNLIGGVAINPDFPAFVNPTTVDVTATASRLNANFIDVQVQRPEGTLVGFSDYHLQFDSPAIDRGAASFNLIGAPADDYDHQTRPRGSGFDIGADEADMPLFFSTEGNVSIPGVPGLPSIYGAYDDADIYAFDGANFRRVVDFSSLPGLPMASILLADVDALEVVDDDTFYVSFLFPLPIVTGVSGVVMPEDVLLYDAGVWSMYFDGSDVGLSPLLENVDGFEILPDGGVLISTLGDGTTVPGLPGTYGNEDLLQCVGAFGPATSCTWSVYFDGSDVALTTAGENVDAAGVSGGGTIFLSTAGAFSVPGLSGADEDVFICRTPTTGAATACASFQMYFDGSARGVPSDLDAIDLPDNGPADEDGVLGGG